MFENIQDESRGNRKSENIENNKIEGKSKGENTESHFPDESNAPKPEISYQQPQTLNLKPESENMEVHKHPHHVTHKKKWGEYVLEFLMIFLGVTLGFIAENMRENIAERSREKAYIKSIIEDLRNDTLNLAWLGREEDSINHSIDTILLYYNDFGNPSNLALNRNIYSLLGYPVFTYTDRTIQQLKNSGGMRLIKNRTAANDITKYDNKVRNLQNNAAFVDNYFQFLTQQRISVISMQVVEKDYNLKPAEQIKKNNQTYLITNNPEMLIKFKSSIYELARYHSNDRSNQQEVKQQATDLISILNKEYHLK
jgi:hypothetical protein